MKVGHAELAFFMGHIPENLKVVVAAGMHERQDKGSRAEREEKEDVKKEDGTVRGENWRATPKRFRENTEDPRGAPLAPLSMLSARSAREPRGAIATGGESRGPEEKVLPSSFAASANRARPRGEPSNVRNAPRGKPLGMLPPHFGHPDHAPVTTEKERVEGERGKKPLSSPSLARQSHSPELPVGKPLNRLSMHLAPAHPWYVILSSGGGVMGYATGWVKEPHAHVSSVDIRPAFRGQGWCRQMLRYALTQVLRRFPLLHEVTIVNASETGGGLPACFCYHRAAADLGLADEGGEEGSRCLGGSPTGPYAFAPQAK